MNRFELLEKLGRLNKLIIKEYTGTPDEFAARLSVSRSTLYRIIDELENIGIEIKYSRSRCTFYYNNDVFIDVHFSVKEIDDPEELKNINGGCTIFYSLLCQSDSTLWRLTTSH